MIRLLLSTAFLQKWLKTMFNFFKKNTEENGGTSAFSNLKNALVKTHEAIFKGVVDSVTGNGEIDEFELDDVEAKLIKADLGVDFATAIVEKIKENKIKVPELKEFLKKEFIEILNSAGDNRLLYDENKLNIYFVVGVNGVGKTTFIGRLGHKFKLEGKKVLFAAGDTFRAAAEEQLEIWAKRADVEIVRRDKADSASVVFDAIDKARKEDYNVLIIDTAGRLQNKFNLIEELKKIKNVITKNAANANLESILVLDANLGQNGLSQAKVFNEAVNLTAVALTKLDGSSKGGIILAIANEYKLPAKLIGIGEKIDDLIEFNSDEFIEAIF